MKIVEWNWQFSIEREFLLIYQEINIFCCNDHKRGSGWPAVISDSSPLIEPRPFFMTGWKIGLKYVGRHNSITRTAYPAEL